MKNLLLSFLLLSVLLLFSCSKTEEPASFGLKGTWTLVNMTYPEGYEYNYSQDETHLRIYDDSCYYECWMEKAPNGTMISPSQTEAYTLIERGKNDYLYRQGKNTYPLNVVDDSTMVVQEHGCQYTWRMCRDIGEERIRSIIDIVRKSVETPDESNARYVFSDAEDVLQSKNNTLTYGYIFVAVIFVAALNYGYILLRKKRRVEQELRQIREEKRALPEPVREAMNTVEQDFHQSNFYLLLRKRISEGSRLGKEDWDEIEERFKSVYPRFTNTLLTLRNMSQTELQVCLLLKLHVPPTEIANVLCKDTSSISTIRSRLYKKVFGEKGSSRKWDEFIASL